MTRHAASSAGGADWEAPNDTVSDRVVPGSNGHSFDIADGSSRRAESAKYDALGADPKADQAKLADAGEALNWDLRVFDERQKSLRFVCEVPVLIEQRLFLLARTIQGALK